MPGHHNANARSPLRRCDEPGSRPHGGRQRDGRRWRRGAGGGGRRGHADRAAGGKNLAQLIMSYPNTVEIIIIAHSHGSNVAHITSQELAKCKSAQKIHIAYILGTPVHLDTCTPDMDYIDYLYNLFSFEDMIQPVMGLHPRVFPAHPRICNLNVHVDGIEPGHSELHNDTIGKWIPSLHEYLLSFIDEKYLFTNPGTIYFTEQNLPTYEKDSQRADRLERDLYVQIAISNILNY